MSKKLIFDAEEYTKMALVADKLFRSRAKLTDRDWERGNNPVVKELYKKFSLQTMVTEQNEVYLKRSHLRFMEEACKQSIKVLDEQIIPEYNKRGAAEHAEYITKAETNSALYKKVLQKVEKAL